MLLSAIANRRTALEQSALKDFVWTYRTTAPGESIRLPWATGTNLDCIVRWDDGTNDHITAWDQAETTHTYAVAGDHQIRVSGLMDRFNTASGGVNESKDKLISVDPWGDTGIIIITTAMTDCANLISVADGVLPDCVFARAAFKDSQAITTSPVLTMPKVTSLEDYFRNTRWSSMRVFDTSNVTNFLSAFRDNTALLSFPALDYSSATNFSNIFTNCTSLATFDYSTLAGIPGPIDAPNGWFGCALDQDSVNGILVELDKIPGADWDAKIVSMTSGTNAAPTGAGITAKNSLLAKNCDIRTN